MSAILNAEKCLTEWLLSIRTDLMINFYKWSKSCSEVSSVTYQFSKVLSSYLLAMTETQHLHPIWGLSLAQSVISVTAVFCSWAGAAGATEGSWSMQNPGGAGEAHTQRAEANPSNEFS